MRELITSYIRKKTAEGLADATIEGYCYALRDFWHYHGDSIETTSEDIESYFCYLRSKNYSPATLRDKYAVLHAFFSYATQEGYYSKNPVRMKKPPMPKIRARCFTDEEIEAIMRYYADRDTFCKLRDYTIISILFSTGIRRAELLNITAVDGANITVIGKGNKERSIPISNALRQVLREYLPAREKVAVNCPYLIVTQDGKRLTTGGLRAIFTRLSRQTGIAGRRFSSHTWRHTYATQFLRNGGDLLSLQRLLGHADLQTTAIYLHWTDGITAEANRKYNPLDNFKRKKFFI